MLSRLIPGEPRRRELSVLIALLAIACVASLAGMAVGSGPAGQSRDLADKSTPDPTPGGTFGEIGNATYAPGFTVTPVPKPTPRPLPTPISGKAFRFVAIGDSLTALPAGSSWPSCLDAMDPKAKLVHNAGVPGDLTSQMADRFDRDVIAYHPDLVLIMGGTNDIASDHNVPQAVTIHNLRSMIRSAKANKIKPFLMLIPPEGFANKVARVRSLNAALIHLANSEAIYYVDDFTPLATSDGVYKSAYTIGDGLHLNEAGANVVARAAWLRIRRLGY
jgi:lysophospholipase L1-like esterase